MTIMFSEFANDNSKSSRKSVINDSVDLNNCKWGNDNMPHYDSTPSTPLCVI